MSNEPAPASTAPPDPPARFVSRSAWAVVIACLVVILATRWQPGRTTAAHPPSSPQQMALRLMARYVVGAKALLSMVPQQEPQNLDQTLMQLKQYAATAPQKLQLVPVIAELVGAEAALQWLDGAQIPDEARQLQHDARVLRAILVIGPDALDPEDRERLLHRYGWFGKLALSWQLPPTDPLRRDALSPAVRTAVTGIAALLGIGVMMLIGVGLLILAISLRMQGSLRGLFHPPERGGGFFIEAFAIHLVWFVVTGLLARSIGGSGGSRYAWTVLAGLAPLACLWPMVRGVKFAELRSALGWHTGRGVLREAFSGIVGYVAGLPIMATGIISTIILSRRFGVQPSHPAVEMISCDPWRILGLLALASLYAPVVEETMFRGALYGGLRRALGIILSTVLVSFIFAAIHPQGLVGVPALMGIAIVLSLLREWRGSLIAPITAHAINNGAVIVFLTLAVA